MPITNEPQEGLYDKFTVIRNSTASPVREHCFVLFPGSDPVARQALFKYATTTQDIKLGRELMAWLDALYTIHGEE